MTTEAHAGCTCSSIEVTTHTPKRGCPVHWTAAAALGNTDTSRDDDPPIPSDEVPAEDVDGYPSGDIAKDDPFVEQQPKWPPPGGITTKAYRCGTCSEVFRTDTNHWGDIYTCPVCKSDSRSVCVEPAPEGYARPVKPTTKTRIYYYRFNVSDPAQRRKWEFLKADLKAIHGKCFSATRNRREVLKDGMEEITLETDFLACDQWNSTTSRVFDWYLSVDYGTPNIRAGHYLEITEEMRALRHNTIRCAYCGRTQTASRTSFHLGCLGYELLCESDLPLLRWRRIDETTDRTPLTDEEKAWLVPLYRSRQIHGAAGSAKREEIQAEFESAVAKATTKRDGMMWLLDHAIKLDNVIFYDHTDHFSFGWKRPLSAEEQTELKSRLAEFPFRYDLK